MPALKHFPILIISGLLCVYELTSHLFTWWICQIKIFATLCRGVPLLLCRAERTLAWKSFSWAVHFPKEKHRSSTMGFTLKTTELFLQPRALPPVPPGREARTWQVGTGDEARQDAGEAMQRSCPLERGEKHHLILKVRGLYLPAPNCWAE